jgi:LCP family protein required for cell wall assembly
MPGFENMPRPKPPSRGPNLKLVLAALAPWLAVGCLIAASRAFMSGVQGVVLAANTINTPLVTPFQPIMPTPTPEFLAAIEASAADDPAAFPYGNFPAPTELSAIPVPPPAALIPFDHGVVNILFLGSDERAWSPGHHRTDAIMIVSLDPGRGRVTLLSIPRDLYVYIPGYHVDRINVADAHGGADTVILTVLYNLGIPIQHWTRVRFEGFIAIVDALGGIDVEITREIYDECDEVQWHFTPGVQHMDGFTALCYARLRKTTNDFDRLRRQQLVVQAVFNRLLSLNALTRAPELFSAYSRYVETDVSITDLLPLIPLATTIAGDSSRVQRFAIDHTMAKSWSVPTSGASVLLPDYAAIQAMLQAAFAP